MRAYSIAFALLLFSTSLLAQPQTASPDAMLLEAVREDLPNVAEYELTGGRFEPVLRDDVDGEVSRIVLTTGKIYYDLVAARTSPVPIVRLEQFYPFPQPMIVSALQQYPNATEIVWVQEEPRNMGAWPFLHDRLPSLLSQNQTLRYVGRPISASPATGSHHRHEEQQRAIVESAIG